MTINTSVNSIFILLSNYKQLISALAHILYISLVHKTLLCTYYNDVIMGAMAPQITSLTIVYSTVYLGADLSKHQSSPSLAFVWGIHRGPVNSPHGEFPAQMASNAENISIWWRHHAVRPRKYVRSSRFVMFWCRLWLADLPMSGSVLFHWRGWILRLSLIQWPNPITPEPMIWR